MKTLKDNINELPKWAQSEIKIIQMKLGEANGELSRINSNEKSNTFYGYENQIVGASAKYLKNNERVTFVLPNGTIQVFVRGERIEIYCNPINGDLFIKPVVSNVVLAEIIKK